MHSYQLLDISNGIAIAEYCDLLPAIASVIEKVLIRIPGIWQDVALEPAMYRAIPIKIRFRDVFIDAARHLVGQAQDPGGRSQC